MQQTVAAWQHSDSILLCVFALAALMLLSLAFRRSCGNFFSSGAGVAWTGSVGVCASPFYYSFLGPWGGEISLWKTICHNLSWEQLPPLLQQSGPVIASGILLGELFLRRRLLNERNTANLMRPISVFLFMYVTIWATRLIWWYGVSRSALPTLQPLCLMLAQDSPPIGICVLSLTSLRAHRWYFPGLVLSVGLWNLARSMPIQDGGTLKDFFEMVGPGYWLQLLGGAAIGLGGAMMAGHSHIYDPERCSNCGYIIVHLVSCRCPECGSALIKTAQLLEEASK